MSRITGTFESVARELTQAGPSAVRRGRGAVSRVLNSAARDAETTARQVWANPTVSPGQITARMAKDKRSLDGYLIGDGEGGFFQEVGSGSRAPQPVLGPALERSSGAVAKALAEVAGRLDR